MDGEVSADTIEEVRAAMTRTKDALVLPGDRSGVVANRAVTEQWMALIVYTISARLEMMKLASEFPFVARTMFEPRQVTQANPGLKMAIIQDIARGKDGSIVLKTHEKPDVRAYEDQNLLDYLLAEELALTEQMRDSFRCMALGAQALGGRICPAQKRYGLCFEVANEIDLAQFPTLEHKVDSLLTKQRQQNIHGCVRLAKTFPFEKVYDITNISSVVEKRRPTDGGSQGTSKRAARKVSEEKIGDGAARVTGELYREIVQKIVVAMKEAKLEIDCTSRDSDEQIGHVASELVHADGYLAAHDNDEQLEHFLVQAVAAIVRGESTGTKRATDIKGVVNADGVLEKAYRLSGNEFVGAGGGRLGKRTRILFTAATKGSVRYVTIRGIVHRSNATYDRNLGSFFR